MELKKKVLELLHRIGLSEKEAQLYLKIYNNPKLTISELKKLCGFSTATTYRVFENLKDKKLITSSPENWRKNVEAVSLRTIAEKLGRESLKLRKTEYELRKLENLMQLSSFQTTEEPIEILNDQNQITEHCYKLLNADWSHITCYGSSQKAYEVPGQTAMHDFVNMRVRRGKTIDAIFTELGDSTKELLKNNQLELRNGKLHIDPTCQNSMTHIHNKQVTIWQNEADLGKRAILINDPGLIKMYQANFQKTWASI